MCSCYIIQWYAVPMCLFMRLQVLHGKPDIARYLDVMLQTSQRPSKVSLDKAAAQEQPLPSSGQAPSADKHASSSGAADLALIWTLEGPEGQASRIGATHFYDVQEKVSWPSLYHV